MSFIISRSYIHPKNKYRIYDESYVKQIGFIVKMKKLGFTLTDIKILISITNLPASECITIRDFMLEKANEIERKILELELLKEALIDISDKCHEGYGLDQCPIIEKLINNA